MCNTAEFMEVEPDRFTHTAVTDDEIIANLRHALNTLGGRCSEFGRRNLELRTENSKLRREVEELRTLLRALGQEVKGGVDATKDAV